MTLIHSDATETGDGSTSLDAEPAIQIRTDGRGIQLGGVEEEALPTKAPILKALLGDARDIPLEDNSVDLVTTSPPYWKKRDYGVADQIGQEATPAEYTASMIDCLREWRRVLRPTGSVFLNIGDTFHKRSLAGVPARVEAAAADDGWIIRNRIIWAKDGGMPEPARNRLANRHEYIIHLVAKPNYYYDLFGYSQAVGNGANPGDVWRINPERNMGRHLAPFPTEIVRRAILLACPSSVCEECGKPRQRIVERTTELDMSRPQARRAVAIAEERGLTPEHIAAIQATGVSDAGKALQFQDGTGRNALEVRRLAAEAKEALGGYFREFTFPKRQTTGWTRCECGGAEIPGVVLDPFMGTGTTLRKALEMGRSGIGIDLDPSVADL
ncbi:MAG TPA: site-specific DNA-methyltransferase [Solirubrobacteraceae bacterium]|nr:site-specific DNA-methyltransferase [Solirubrobacteraceae bacterium]